MRPSRARPRAPTPRLAGLYREHWLALARLAVLLVGDRGSAEDVVQDWTIIGVED